MAGNAPLIPLYFRLVQNGASGYLVHLQTRKGYAMQIGHTKHITLPGVGNQPTAPKSSDDSDSTTLGAAVSGRGAAVRPITPAQDAPGVVAKIQSSGDGTAPVALPPGLVYSNARKAAAAEDSDADTARMAEQHRQAMERASQAPSGLAVGKDGLLVAKPAQTKSEEFVRFAVNTLREYADEQARLKAQSAQDESASHLIPRNLGDVQRLAARFKLFT